jgi:hypothetical protein
MRSFIIPSANNSITEEDIKTGVLRITVEFKEYFPDGSGELLIEYGKVSKTVKFEYREGRSHRLSVGRPFMINLGLTSSSKLKFIEVVPKKFFLIEKLQNPQC